MLLERVSLALRPRTPWEAMDLGFRMMRLWWLPVYSSWLLVYVPVIALITSLAVPTGHPFWGLLALWWLKPLMERAPLYVLSRAVFGGAPALAEMLRALPGVYRPTPWWRLLLTRLSPTRSFCLPVLVLERLKGKAGRTRCAVLLKTHYAAATWLTIVCSNFEWVLASGAYALVEMLLPRTVEIQIDNANIFSSGIANAYLWILYGSSVLAYLIMGPLYTAGGFALYLNRRTLLEAWDIELGFRRMAARLTQQPTAWAALLPLCILSYTPQSSWATALPPTNPVAAQHIAHVMQQPEFNTKLSLENWEYKDKKTDAAQPRAAWDSALLSQIGRALAWLVKGALYLALFIGIVWLILNRQRWLKAWRGIKPVAAYQAPQQLFGLDLRPASLPADIPAAARALWQSGQARAAMSLLYRGALSRLTVNDVVQLKASDTEGDCVHAVASVVTPPTGDYFKRLTQAWQTVAYAARTPAAAEAEQLCADFDQHFASQGRAS